MAVVMSELHDLPDLVINRILGFLPTKAAVHATFLSKRHAVSSASELSFDEYDEYDPFKLVERFSYQHEKLHNKFINFLRGYLDYHEKYEKKESVDTLRLHTSMYLARDASVIDGWLDRAVNKGLKELDISPCQRSRIKETVTLVYSKMYPLPWVIFARNNAQSLVSLNLEHMKIFDIKKEKLRRDKKYLLPSLKSMTLSWVWFDNNALYSLLLECPSIKYLSLDECCFRDFKCRVLSSSLEHLELSCCNQLRELQVHDETKNLESLAYFSKDKPYSVCENVIMNKSFKLKSIIICTETNDDNYGSYHLPWVTLFSNAKFLTSMTLACTRIANISANVQSDERLLPSLKTLSFAFSWFADKALSSLLLQCPSLEKLSITVCSSEHFKCHVSSSNLKSLEVLNCQALKVLQVDDEAKNLESFTFVHPSGPNFEKVILNNTFNMKNICISVDELAEISINGFHRTLNGKINVQNLNLFDFLGTLNDEFSVKGWQGAKIAVPEVWFKNWFVHYSSYFPRLIGCLKEFGCWLQEHIPL